MHMHIYIHWGFCFCIFPFFLLLFYIYVRVCALCWGVLHLLSHVSTSSCSSCSLPCDIRASVVTQFYITEAENEYVIKGNSAVMKCKIPSFVADFVQVEAWINAEDGSEFSHSNDSNAYGSNILGHILFFFFFHYCFLVRVFSKPRTFCIYMYNDIMNRKWIPNPWMSMIWRRKQNKHVKNML